MAFRLACYYAATFLAIGVVVPFWPAWLQGRGLSPAEIGVVLSVGAWVRVASNPLIAQFADRRGRPDRVLVVLAWLTLAAHLAYAGVDGFWPILAVSTLAGIAFSAMFPLGDAVTMQRVREGTVDYGRVRLWGSITFVVAAMGGGQVLTDRPSELILWLIIGCLVMQLGAVHRLPETRTVGMARFGTPLIEVVRNGSFLAFIAVAGLLQASHAAYYAFATLYWIDAGYDEVVIGMLWAEGTIAEIVLFAVAKKVLTRLSPLTLVGLGAAAGVVRWMVLGWTFDPVALIAVQLLHAFTFGAVHLAVMHHIARAIPAMHGATAQSVYSSFTSMTMATSTMVSGWLYASVKGSTFFAMAAVSLAGGIAALLVGWRARMCERNGGG